MKYIDQLSLNSKKVFIRADLNVPFDNEGNISDDNRIKATVPTVKYALDNGAKVILASHLGRPKGKDPKESLKPVVKRLSELLNVNVKFVDDCIGDSVIAATNELKNGEVLLLENLRFYKEEEKNDPQFAENLSKLADVYVNDAFATAHRAHASTAGMVKYFKEAAGGFTLKSELGYFEKAFSNPERPLVAIFGGAKVSTKISAIRNVAKRANRIIVGGAMANTFFAADGHNVGKSLCEHELLDLARQTKKELSELGCELILPVDVVVASEFKGGIPTSTVNIDSIPSDKMALDIGAKSIQLIENALADAKTIIWNGPMGAFETPEYSHGTYALVDILCKSKALTVVGGGDTDLALHNKHAYDKMSYVSTAGGAFLCLLEGAELPAVVALEKI